jgi:hypothetical protein
LCVREFLCGALALAGNSVKRLSLAPFVSRIPRLLKIWKKLSLGEQAILDSVAKGLNTRRGELYRMAREYATSPEFIKWIDEMLLKHESRKRRKV